MRKGDRVKVVGPALDQPKEFTITQEQGEKFSSFTMPWYPETSLELVSKPKTFEIGQKVRITGPDWRGIQNQYLGREFTISQMPDKCRSDFGCMSDMDCYSDAGFPMFPASSLELVEEGLKIGDEVEVIGPAGDEYITAPWDPKTFTITEIREPHGEFGRTYRTKYTGQPGYPASSLRKIPKAEDLSGINPKDLFESRIVAYCKATNAGNINVHDRLTGLEKQLDDLSKKLTTFHDFQMLQNKETGKRLRFLETWQGEHDLEKQSRFKPGAFQIAARMPTIKEARGILADLKPFPLILPVGRYISPPEKRILFQPEFLESVKKIEAWTASKQTDPVAKILDEPEIQKGDYVRSRLSGRIYRVLDTEDRKCQIQHENVKEWLGDHNLQKLSPEEILERLNRGPA